MGTLWTAYEYFFYRTYLFQRSFGPLQNPTFTSAAIVSVLLYLNLLSILLAIKSVSGFDTPINDLFTLVILALLLTANWSYFSRPGKFSYLHNTFSTEPASRARRRTWFCALYVALTVALFVGTATMVRQGAQSS